MSKVQEIKQLITQRLFQKIKQVEGVISVTLVGSFCDRDDLSVISDIDTIVICDKLDQELYNRCIESVGELSGADLGFPDKKLHINPTFGPLKFDTDELIVVHLMIYDVAAHRDHVLKSPFTCYDWERSQVHEGPSLAQIYPVLQLQPRDFTQARRGIQNYLEDLERGVMSYRRYSFEDGKVEQVLEHKKLDARHQGEYAFHIVKNLVANYSKMICQQNLPPDDQLLLRWRELLPDCAWFIPHFEDLEKIKLQRGVNFPTDTIELVKRFINSFEESFRKQWESPGSIHHFCRHAATPLNDGSFLGQARNPGISNPQDISPLDCQYRKLFSSPLLRARESAERLAPNMEVDKQPLLMEINYGKAEGLSYAQLVEQYPEIAEAWKRGEDPSFPEGENSEMVRTRIDNYLQQLASVAGPSLNLSHNVVLRSLVGKLYQVAKEEQFKITIPHLLPLELIQREHRWYPNLSHAAKARITDSLIAYCHE